uniref:Uncharacterized protein n=1 Tax=Tetraselmis sp. GSL018 TaxID=582737 RepID=A0A061QP57_9CHLO
MHVCGEGDEKTSSRIADCPNQCSAVHALLSMASLPQAEFAISLEALLGVEPLLAGSL